VDLTLLGAATRLTFGLSSSDNGPFGMNTPAYFALDSLTVTPVPEPGALALAGLAAGLGGITRVVRGSQGRRARLP
jgi:hypothetical protein